jgi:hypothetical protein
MSCWNWSELHSQRPVPSGAMVTCEQKCTLSLRCIKEVEGWRWQIVIESFRPIEGSQIDGLHDSLETAQKACENAFIRLRVAMRPENG